MKPCGPDSTRERGDPAGRARRDDRSWPRKASTNFLPLVVDTFSQVMKVDGYYTPARRKPSPWQWWLRNRFGARQTGITAPRCSTARPT
jgi:hypothetical protein